MRKDITAFIRDLLLEHDCVIIPGFGGFIGNYMPASIEKSSSTFYPPLKQISFNRNLNSNDGLLIGKVSSSLGVNYGDARNIVSEYVDDLKRKLSGGTSVTFDQIGTFTLNSEGNPLFEPDRSSNFLLSSYGLDSFHRSPVEQKHSAMRIGKTREEKINRSASLRRVMWRAAVVIPLATALVFVPLKYDLFKGKVEQSSMNPLLSAQLDENIKANSEEKTSYTQSFTARPDESAVAEPGKETEIAIAEPVVEGVFKVIAGSFRSEDNALRLSEKLVKQGYNPELRLLSNGFYRVAMREFNEYSKAIVFTKEMSDKYPDLWISKEK